MTPKLRWYQEKAIELVDNSFARGARNPLICMPTGAGKSLFIAEYIRRNSDKKFLFVAHTRELLRQIADTFRRVGLQDFVVLTETPTKEISSRVVVCGIDRLRRGEGFVNNPDIIVCDEAHLYPSVQRFNTLKRFKNAKIIGLSATPSRGDMNTLDKIFDCIFHPVLTSDLLKEGNLVPVELYGAEDRTRVDWDKSYENDWPPYVAYRQYCKGKRTLVFTNKTQQSKVFLKFLADEGVKAAEVNGTMPKQERDRILAKFASAELECIVNVRVLTAGYDLPELQAIMLLSPSLERSTYLQVVGRVARPSPGKTHGIVCDMSGAFKEHGLPLLDSWYSLFDGEKESNCDYCGEELKYRDWVIEKRIECETCQKTKHAGRHCPKCGWHFQKIEEEKKPKKQLTHKEKEAYPQHLAEKITDFISSRAPVMYANSAGISGRLKDSQERDKVIAWQTNNWNSDDVETRQATYLALISHRLFLERVRKRKYNSMWSRIVYMNNYGRWPNKEWEKFVPGD